MLVTDNGAKKHPAIFVYIAEPICEMEESSYVYRKHEVVLSYSVVQILYSTIWHLSSDNGQKLKKLLKNQYVFDNLNIQMPNVQISKRSVKKEGDSYCKSAT